jgi:hypothetical protein
VFTNDFYALNLQNHLQIPSEPNNVMSNVDDVELGLFVVPKNNVSGFVVLTSPVTADDDPYEYYMSNQKDLDEDIVISCKQPINLKPKSIPKSIPIPLPKIYPTHLKIKESLNFSNELETDHNTYGFFVYLD